MSAHLLVRAGRRLSLVNTQRWKSTSSPTKNVAASAKHPVSSCPAGTVLAGLNWLKGQPPVLALEDPEYPEWLWTILDKAPEQTMRRQNRERIRTQNFMKKQ